MALSAVALTLASYAATQLRPLPGPTLLVVRAGPVALDGPGRPPGAPRALGPGDQLGLPAGAVVRLRNRAEEPAAVLLVALVPAPEDRPSPGW